MTKNWTVSFTITGMLLLMLTCAMPAWAGNYASHYAPGTEGAMGPSVPPPGFHYKQYNYYLESDTLNDDNGDDMNVDLELDVFVQAHRLIYITKQKLFGADYGMSAIVQFSNIDINVGAMGYNEAKLGLGDIFIEPLILAWHTDRWDTVLGLGVNLPTGNFDTMAGGQAKALESAGQGCVSGMMSLGATYYLDQAKSWTVSALSRTLVYGEQDDTDVTPGWEVVVDWGIAKQFPISKGLLVRPALVGTALWQIDEDSGPGASDDKCEVYAIGGEVNLFWLPPHLWQLNLRALQDISAESGPEATRVVLSVTKSF